MVRPSCPALVIHDDDAFRKNLIAALDQHHFTVTFSSDGDEAIELLRSRKFRVVLVGLNLTTRHGTRVRGDTRARVLRVSGNQKAEVRNQKSEIRNQKSEESRNQSERAKTEKQEQKAETSLERNQKPETRNQKPEEALQFWFLVSGF